MKVVWALGVAVVALAGFFAGWSLGGQRSSERSGEHSGRPEAPPPATTSVMPPEDAPGAELREMPRYPGSIRIEYGRENLGEIIATEAEYATTASPQEIREFYRRVFETEGWEEADIGFHQGEFFYLVTRDDHEVVIDIEELAEFTQIEIELSEPQLSEPRLRRGRDPELERAV